MQRTGLCVCVLKNVRRLRAGRPALAQNIRICYTIFSHYTIQGNRKVNPLASKYILVSNDLAARIQSGMYPAGSRMPAENQLIREYGVSQTRCA
ncbi:MAG TPA: GntR family transcriptional regulator, partial [Candidatus Gemmiger faecigallinarum]|nr:GntR family transcriptional regulator [Candidatus Gemmiger faecigallinarum]